MNKKLIATTVCAAAVTSAALAGPASEKSCCPSAPAGFDAARRPMSNPTLFDLALPRTGVHAIYMHHKLPSQVALAGGAKLPLGGDVNAYAVQFEYALNDRLSIVATKDGYVDFNPDNTNNFSQSGGFADLAAGLKYAFILDPVQQLAVSGSLTIELPTGDGEVFQGNGDGGANFSLAALKLSNDWQFAGALGVYLPFDSDAESTTAFASAHVGYNITDRLYGLVEVNWYGVLSEGAGQSAFTNQVGGAVPAAVSFEGGDLFNLGAANGSDNGNIVTAAVGVRYQLCDNADLGLAYELPLTDADENLMDSRITLDLVLTF